MPKWKHIDTTGLPSKYDCADLLEEGLTKQEIVAWMVERMRDGPPPRHMEPVKSEAKPKPKPKPAKPLAPEPEPEEHGNVTALRKPIEDELLAFPPEFSEDALAEKFTERYAEDLIYCGSWGSWLEWKGTQWEKDETHRALHYARIVARDASNDILKRTDLGDKRHKMAPAIVTRRTIGNIEGIAKTDPRHAVRPQQFDSDPWLLNTPDGVVDLRTGQLRPARRSDFVTKVTAVGPNNRKPTIWLNYLEQATDGDAELAGYLQRIAGYCLTGSIAEHAFFFCYGGGGNGKGIYKDFLDWMLNSYARAANIDTFIDHRFARHSAELAFFQGARLVTSTEPPEGARWAEGRIKAMTGGDPITANFMHQNPFTFAPLFKLLFTGNHRPQLNAVDAAIKRRLYLIPFDFKVTEENRDYALPDKIREPEEAGGILNWMIEGCMEWQRTMLKPPKRVIYATNEYLETEDRVGRFIAEKCEIGKHHRVRTALLFIKYKEWAHENSEFTLPKKRFLNLLRGKGYVDEPIAGEQCILGIGLK